jgi:murein L,D-transpeptidase YafK
MRILSIVILLVVSTFCSAQTLLPTFPDNSFYNFQMSYDRVRNAVAKYESSWSKLFKEKNLQFPKTDLFIRHFKADGKLEVWARNTTTDTFTLVKEFPVCLLSGKMGPKRRENDKQVPEGYYFIDEFNPKSNYFLSLLVSYPNYSDLIKGDKENPGYDIYVHGSCVSVGCVPITDDLIQELYVLTMLARTNGQLYIPIHVFPTRFTRTGLNYLGAFYSENDNQKFWTNLKRGYDYFERTKRILPVLYDDKGNYVY